MGFFSSILGIDDAKRDARKAAIRAQEAEEKARQEELDRQRELNIQVARRELFETTEGEGLMEEANIRLGVVDATLGGSSGRLTAGEEEDYLTGLSI